jgi:hypothetical protein
MMRAATRLAVSVLFGEAVAQASAPTTAAPRDITIGVSGKTNTAPSIAATGRVVVVAWGVSMRGATDVYVPVSRAGGRTFGVQVRVNDVDSDASVGGEQPPHVALVPRAW